MLKQSRNHTNLPAHWQGRAPDYELVMTRHNPLHFDFASVQFDNRKTIARLQSALLLRRQQFAHKHKEI